VPGKYNVGLQVASQKEDGRGEEAQKVYRRFGPENTAFERGLQNS
jgi:hypothetical protein